MKTIVTVLIFIAVCSIHLKAQIQISGKVTAENDSTGLPGLNIMVVGTEMGTITDFIGNYKLEVPKNATLKFSYVGFADQEVIVGNKSLINVQMHPDVKKLQEIVITALAIPREVKALNYSVTEVDGAEFTKAREVNTANQLAGRVAGVNVSNMSTGPAGASRVIIRGNKSLMGNNQPLYVVDGIPFDNTTQSQAGKWGGSDWGDGTISLSPDDIESMSVLKGASASALYGSRASNGVILITTKKGTKQKGIGVEFNSNFVLEKAIDYTDFQTKFGHGLFGFKPSNTNEAFLYGTWAWGGRLDGSLVPQFDGVERPYTYQGNNTEKFFQTGKIFTNTLALTGGNDAQTYRMAVSHLKNIGIMPNSDFERVNLSLNLKGAYGRRRQFKVEGRVLYSYEYAENRPRVSDLPGNGNTVSLFPPSIGIRDLRGDADKPGATFEGQTNPIMEEVLQTNFPLGSELMPVIAPVVANPFWAAYQFEASSNRDRISPLINLRYNFTEWLYGQIRTGMDLQTGRDRIVTPYGTSFQRTGGVREPNSTLRETNIEWMLGVDKLFGEWGLHGFIGGNMMRRYQEYKSINASELVIPFFHVLSNGAQSSFNHEIVKKGINSLFGSLEFNFKNYLYVTATARNDWFSTLDPERNSILYPSVGLSWVLSDTFGFPSWWNMAKLRASWAQVGGDTDPYHLDLTYEIYNPGNHGEAVLGTIAQSDIPNRALVPLTSTETEIGMNIRFLDNRLGLDVALYWQETTNDIVNTTISQASGYSGRFLNVGRMRNQGIELLLTAIPVKGIFTWDLGFNIAFNENEVLELAEGVDYLIAGESRTGAAIQHKIGESYGNIVGTTHVYDSVRKDYKYVVQKFIEGADTLVSAYPVRSQGTFVIGNGVHPITGGFSNTLSWKGWNLGFLIDFKFGGDMHSGTNTAATGSGMHKKTLQGRESEWVISGINQYNENFSETLSKKYLHNYWGILPSTPGHSKIHEYYIYDASFVKLRQLTFGYTFQPKLLVKTPFTYLDLSFVGRNLALLYGNVENVDPESNYQNGNAQGLEHIGVPQTRTYGFNLRIGF